MLAWCRRSLTCGSFDVISTGDSPQHHATSCFAAAAMLLHLTQPAVFGMDIAAAACAALAAPFIESMTDAELTHDSKLRRITHRAAALAGLRSLRATLSVPGFTAAVAREEPSALAAIVAGLKTSGSGKGQAAVAAAFAPAALEVLCCAAAFQYVSC
jgi:hypothetical protein